MQKLARKVANDALRSRGATLGDRYEDLVSSLCVVGLRAALRYDPETTHTKYGKNGGEPFASYIADVMNHRVVDFFRAKSEGFGDRRYGNDGRMTLVGDVIEELASDRGDEELPEPAPSVPRPRPRPKWKDAAELLDEDFAEWTLVSERRVMKWIRAAETTDYTFQEWVVRTLDMASEQLLPRTAA